MRRTNRLPILLAALAFAPLAARADVRYTLRPVPASRTLLVSITLQPKSDEVTFRIPAWCPGYYFILNYQNKLSGFSAVDPEGHPLEVEHADPRAWQVIDPGHRPITVSYRIMSDDPGLGFFGVNVRAAGAFVNGAAAFLYADGYQTEPDRLHVDMPEGWAIATAMDHAGETDFAAAGYDELIDHPIEMGRFARRTFKVLGIPFEAVFVAPDRANCNIEAETERLRELSVPAIRMFGSAPFRRYVYIVHLAVGEFSGGLEHRASCVLAIQNAPELQFEELAAHEYFHAWNVKQIRPDVLGPFDYTHESRTGNLWFAEGVTDYYAHLTLYRSGLRDEGWLLDQLGQQIATLQSSRNRLAVTLEECSRRAWENGGFGVGDLSYYNKGLVAGLVLDAAIRSRTRGAKSLDDVMRALYRRYRMPNRGYAEDGLLASIAEVGGADMAPLYRILTQTTYDVPYGMLSGIGLGLDAGGEVVAPNGGADPRLKALYRGWLGRVERVVEQGQPEPDRGRH